MDPLHAFSGYPSFISNRQTRFQLIDANFDQAISRYKSYSQLSMVNYAKYLMPSLSEVSKILQELNHEPKSMSQIINLFENPRQPWIARSLVWLTKLGILKVVN